MKMRVFGGMSVVQPVPRVVVGTTALTDLQVRILRMTVAAMLSGLGDQEQRNPLGSFAGEYEGKLKEIYALFQVDRIAPTRGASTQACVD